ncbi:unnamed protein product [Effrenium voratum]|nr:unnamed protein product [Effrenium voratum]
MDAWAQAFIAEAESGHAGRTLQLVEAVRHERWTVEAAACTEAALGMVPLKAALDKESSAAGRNRILRQWLGKCKSQVVDAWSSLGFPMPPPDMRAEGPVRTDLLCPTWQPIGHSPAVPAPGQMCAPVSGGVAVLDFDQTLTTRHVGVFEDMARINRAFGGAERVELVRDFLARLSDMVTVTVVSWGRLRGKPKMGPFAKPPGDLESTEFVGRVRLDLEIAAPCADGAFVVLQHPGCRPSPWFPAVLLQSDARDGNSTLLYGWSSETQGAWTRATAVPTEGLTFYECVQRDWQPDGDLGRGYEYLPSCEAVPCVTGCTVSAASAGCGDRLSLGDVCAVECARDGALG